MTQEDNTFPNYSKSKNEELKKIYGHGDCAAFADMLHWDFEDKNLNSKIIMAGTRIANHFYVRIEDNSGKTAYCDVYGVFKNEEDILSRYGIAKEETYEVNNPEENNLFQTLIESSDLYTSLEDTDEKNEIFFTEMQTILQTWKETLIELPGQKKPQEPMNELSDIKSITLSLKDGNERAFYKIGDNTFSDSETYSTSANIIEINEFTFKKVNIVSYNGKEVNRLSDITNIDRLEPGMKKYTFVEIKNAPVLILETNAASKRLIKSFMLEAGVKFKFYHNRVYLSSMDDNSRSILMEALNRIGFERDDEHRYHNQAKQNFKTI